MFSYFCQNVQMNAEHNFLTNKLDILTKCSVFFVLMEFSLVRDDSV